MFSRLPTLPAHKTLRQIPSIAWKLFVGIGAAFGFASATLGLLPSVSVSPNEQLGQQHEASFVIKNDGLITIRSLGVLCWADKIQLSDGRLLRSGYGITTGELRARRLQSRQGFTFSCPEDFIPPGSELQSADITVIVSYSPPWFPWTFDKPFRYVGKLDDQNRFVWMPQPQPDWWDD